MTNHTFKVGDEVVYRESGNFEYRTIWGISPGGSQLWLKGPGASGAPYQAAAGDYIPYVRELKVGAKVRLRKTFDFAGELRHVGAAEPKYIRYISKYTVVYETFGSGGVSFGETALDRVVFDDTYEADPT